MIKAKCSTLEGFTEELSEAICDNENNRHNNMAMIAALSVKEIPQILNQQSMFSATIAYRKVLKVLCKVKLGVRENTGSHALTLTYDRFNSVVKVAKQYLVTINS